MKIILANVKYSQNLGDGLLCECLERGLVDNGFSESNVASLDLAGRTAYSANSSMRSKIIAFLGFLPKVIRECIVRVVLALLIRGKLARHYRESLIGADLLVVGGGNLFTDIDLNFPKKIAAVIGVANSYKIPVCIYGVGVSSKWSSDGVDMVGLALKKANVRYISVRDSESKVNFEKHFSSFTSISPRVVRDPGLLISKYRGECNSDTSGSKQVIGVCITAGSAVRYHSSEGISDSSLEVWYSDVCELLVENNFDVNLFTNGSAEDVQFAEKVKIQLMHRLDKEYKVFKPQDPTMLAKAIASYDAVLAHRMHALICGFSYGRTIFALEWDSKIRSFMASVGREGQLYNPENDSPIVVVRALQERLKLDQKTLDSDHYIDEAYTDVANLAASISN